MTARDRMTVTRCIALLLVLGGAACHAQIGEWRTLTDLQNVHAIASAGNDCWAATRGGVFHFRRSDGSFLKYTNVEGLSTIDTRSVRIDSAGTVFIGGSDGSLNIFTPGAGWSAVLDIARSTGKPRRGINAIRILGARVYIATDFGVTIFNPSKREFSDTYQKFGTLPSQSAVSDMLFAGDSIWVATEQGVAAADLRTANLQDPGNWISYPSSSITGASVLSLARIDGAIVAGTEKGAALLAGGIWEAVFPLISTRPVLRFVPNSGGAYAVTERQLYDVRSLTDVREFGPYGGPPEYTADLRFTDMLTASDGAVLVGSQIGVAEYRQGQPWTFVKPNGPGSNAILGLSVDASGNLWTGSAGKGIFRFDGETWTTHSVATDPILGTNDIYSTYPASDGTMYFGTWGRGLLIRRADASFLRYDPTTVPGFPEYDTTGFSPVSGMSLDSQGNLWILHRESSDGRVLSCRTAAGAWKYFSPPFSGAQYTRSLVVDQFDNKWFTVDQASKGMVQFNENGTLDATGDDTWARLSASDPDGLASDDALGLAVDAYGDLWIGTNLGLRTILSPRTADNIIRTCYNTRCNIEGQSINCVAIDPVNNKWLGTNAGIIVLSSDGSTILEQYSTQNSPLLDDKVNSIVVHPLTGVAYIATAKGLSALGTPFARPAEGSTTLKISPNPYRPDTDPRLSIDGLPEGSTLKILTVSGHLVAEVATPAGRIGFWDGRTRHGDIAPSGIYIVVAYNADGTKISTGKVALVRK